MSVNKTQLGRLLDDFAFEECATESAISALGGLRLPEDYLSLLREANGGEGFVGEQYLILWRAEELIDFNREYEVDTYAPGLVLFGSTGGGEAFGFDTRSEPYSVVLVPFVGMDLGHATKVAESFSRLIERLAANETLL